MIKMNRETFLNEKLDDVIRMQEAGGQQALRPSRSMDNLRTAEHEAFGEDLSEDSKADSFPGFDLNEEQKL